jgi:hypothetical protein
VAGDRWLISFSARIEIEVTPEYFEGDESPLPVPFEDVRAALGGKATYSREKTRNFVAEAEKDEAFNGLKDRFLESNLSYLSHPDFAKRLILNEYQKAAGLAVAWKPQ